MEREAEVYDAGYWLRCQCDGFELCAACWEYECAENTAERDE